jgi:uncharacterized delta-60 repeat protein
MGFEATDAHRPAAPRVQIDKMRALILAASLALAPSGHAAAAQPGDLDRSFGGDGRVRTVLAGGAATVAGVAVTDKGRILVAATAGKRRALVLRYLPDGRLDRSFAAGGMAVLSPAEDVALNDMVVDGAGRVVLGGSLGSRGAKDAALWRFLPSGVLDSGFGSGGTARVDLGGAEGEEVRGLAAQADGRPVAAVDIMEPRPFHRNDLAVVRLLPGGDLDSSFGEQGVTRVVDPTGVFLSPVAMALEPGAQLLVGVLATSARPGASASVLRLLPDGAIDAPYGGWGNGRSEFSVSGDDTLFDIAADSRTGRVMVAGSNIGEADGRARPVVGAVTGAVAEAYGYGNDLSYGDRGSLLIPLPATDANATAVALDEQGSALVAGGVYGDRVTPFVARVDPSGRLDRGFGTGGVRHVRFSDRVSLAAELAVQPDGGIVVAGPGNWYGRGRPRAVQVFRLHGGYDERAPRVSLRVGRARCADGVLRLRVTARDDSRLRRVVVRLGQRRLAATRRPRFALRLSSARAGGRRITVEATDVAGNTARHTRRLAACA